MWAPRNWEGRAPPGDRYTARRVPARADVAPQLAAELIRHRRERCQTLLWTGDAWCGQGEDALAQGDRFEGTAHLEGAEVVGQPALHAISSLVPLQDLELDLKLASGPPLRPAKHGDQVRRQRQGVGVDGQPPGV